MSFTEFKEQLFSRFTNSFEGRVMMYVMPLILVISILLPFLLRFVAIIK